MCGIFGVVNTSRQIYADDFISDAFVGSMLRGVDSSGIASINVANTDYFLHKLPMNGLYFKDERVAKRYISYANNKDTFTMCHVRAATVGDVTTSNAHPFAIERDDESVLIGTHNGTLTGWKQEKSARGFDVDSEWALTHIATEGIKAFEDFTGAYAFVWWDGGDSEVIHMARNDQRPISVVFLKDGGMAYASEPGMLFWLLERNNIKMDGPILTLDAGQHYMFPVADPKKFTKEALPKKTYNYTNTYGTNYTSTYKTNVDNVKLLIEGSKPIKRVVSKGEVDLAREYGWYGVKADFTPIMYDDNTTEGIAEASGVEFDAIILGNAVAKGFDINHEWLCHVIGVRENGDDIVLILSEPYKTVPDYLGVN